jgi:uncharacterized membrane protein YhaH (DUF805 family)
MNWYLIVLKKYAVFTGRARRKEYWYFVLFNAIITIFLLGLDYLIGLAEGQTGVLSGLYQLGMIIPSFAVLVRRLHDTDRSGWWVVNYIILTVAMGFFAIFVSLITSYVPQTQAGSWLLIIGMIITSCLSLATLIVGIIMFVFTLLKSQEGSNRYGPNPIND